MKMRIVTPLRSLLIAVFAPRASRITRENRLLVINLLALGDLVMFTAVLKHYKQQLPNHRITLLIKSGTRLDKFLKEYVDEIITIDYRRFAVDPIYGFQFIISLRRLGFYTVVIQDFSASEIQAKVIATSLQAERIIGSDGIDVEHRFSFDVQQKKNLHLIERRLLPRYTFVVPTRNMKATSLNRLPNAIEYYAKIFERAAGEPVGDYAPELRFFQEGSSAQVKFGLEGRKYAIMNVSASVVYKRWPIERFARVAEFLLDQNIIPVIIGTRGDRLPVEALMSRVPRVVNLTGRTSLCELVSLINTAYVVVTNDTSTVHVAIALKRPSLCITGGGQFGMQSEYGYSDINIWAYSHTPCYGDNFRCGYNLAPGEVSPCIAAISTESVCSKLAALLQYLEAANRENKSLPQQPFQVEFPANF